MDLQNSIQNAEMYYIYDQLIFNKGAKTIQCGGDGLFNNDLGTTG